MSNKIFNIDFNLGNVLDSDGGILMTTPTISYQAAPNWELHFVENVDTAGLMTPIDVSQAVSWNAAVDVDFTDETQPMIRTLPSAIITSGAASGIIVVPLDANTETFYQKINGRNSIPAYFEIRGRDSNDRVIYDYRFRINALGAIDPQGGEPLPIVSGGVTMADVYALLRSAPEYRYSDDGTNWHPTQQTGDIYYQTRYDGGDWSSTIEMIKGADGTDGEDGTDGTNGVGFKVVGEYNAETTYHPYTTSGYYEVVTHNGSSYAYINATASSGHEPSGTDSYWELIAAKGDTGSVDNITVSDITDFDSTMSGLLSGYALKGESYTVAQSNTLLAAKANASDVYTIEEADNKFVDIDELSEATGNLVTLTQWNNKNAQIQGEIDYLSGVISGGGGGGDLSLYTPLSTTQSISGTLQNEINTISGNVPSSAIEGVNLNNERTLTVSNVAWVLAMPMRTTMPNANDTDQDFMFYVGDDILGSTPPFIKAHLYEKVADASATPPSEDDITISIPDYNIYDVTLTKGGDGAWTGTSQQGQVIRIAYYHGSPDTRCKYTYGISINNTVEIMGVNEVSDELPWQVYPWEIVQTETTTPVTMSHAPHGGGDARTYHWEDISPWASNS